MYATKKRRKSSRAGENDILEEIAGVNAMTTLGRSFSLRVSFGRAFARS